MFTVTPESFVSIDVCFQLYSPVLNKNEHENPLFP